MTATELYDRYSRWTGELHFFAIRDLGQHLDCEYFPDSYQFKVYSGWAEEYSTLSGIPGLSRPPGERVEVIELLRPQDDPSPEDLNRLFRDICRAAARVLEIDIARSRLLK